MNSLAAIYWAQFKVSLAVQFQYRASMSIWLIGRVIEPVIYLVVWRTVVRAQGGTLESYSEADFAAYYIMLMIVNHLTFTWIMFEYEYYIKNGTLASLLLRPLHPIHRDIAENIAYKVLTFSIILPTAFLLSWIFQPAFDLQIWSTLAFIPALLLAFVLRFAMGWTLAMAAFWTTRVSAFNSTYFVAVLFFSGQIAPLELFPDWLQIGARFSPFPGMAAFPIELILGKLTMREVIFGFAIQLAWAAICIGVLQFIWQAGTKRFSAVGA